MTEVFTVLVYLTQEKNTRTEITTQNIFRKFTYHTFRSKMYTIQISN